MKITSKVLNKFLINNSAQLKLLVKAAFKNSVYNHENIEDRIYINLKDWTLRWVTIESSHAQFTNHILVVAFKGGIDRIRKSYNEPFFLGKYYSHDLIAFDTITDVLKHEIRAAIKNFPVITSVNYYSDMSPVRRWH